MIIGDNMSTLVPNKSTSTAEWYFQYIGGKGVPSFREGVDKDDAGGAFFKNGNPLGFTVVQGHG